MKSRLLRTVTSVKVGDEGQILGHFALGDGVQGGLFQLVGEGHQFGDAVQLTALAQSARPRKDGGHGVGGGLLALQGAVVVALNGAVRLVP